VRQGDRLGDEQLHVGKDRGSRSQSLIPLAFRPPRPARARRGFLFPLGGTGSTLSLFPVGVVIPDGSRDGELTAETQRMEGHPRHPPSSILAIAPNLSARGQFQTG
jgi:hypothetical protein